MKGQIQVIEAITVSIVLIIAFNIMISSSSYQNKWNDALSSLSGRDALLTVERMGKLHEYAFSESKFRTEFLSKPEAIRDNIIKIEIQGTLKEKVLVACNCTQEQTAYLQNSMLDVKVNNRNVDVDICQTNLITISSCSSTQMFPDVLVIWGYRDFGANLANLANLVNNGVGIVEIADIQSSQVDITQQRIFGLLWNGQGNFPANPDTFLKPTESSKLPYQSYKLFYHLPYTLTGTATNTIPIEGGIQQCANSVSTGNFKLQGVNNKFWICGTSSVYFDTNGNGNADRIVTVGNTFSIGQSNFKLNYIEDNFKIRVSFKKDYRFNDFVSGDNSHNKLSPMGNDYTKVAISSGYWDQANTIPVSVSILNGTENSRTVWIADFSRSGLANTGDDHKHLISSLILSASDKKSDSPGTGQLSSYINTVDNDMFEVYSISLKLTKPF